MAGADKMSGGRASQAVQSVKGSVGRTMERMSWLTGRKEGTTATNENAKVEEEKKNAEALFNSSNASDNARAKNITRTSRGAKKAGFLAAAISTNNLSSTYKGADGKVDVAAIEKDLSYSKQFGGKNPRRDATKQVPTLAATDWPTVSKIKDEHPLWNNAQAQHEAVVRAVGKVPEDDLNKDLADALSPAEIRDAGARMTNRRKQAFQRSAYEATRQQRRAMPSTTIAERQARAETYRKERELRNLI